MRGQSLQVVPVLSNIQEGIEVYGVVDPLGLDVLFGLDAGHCKLLPIGHNVRNILVVRGELVGHGAAHGQDHILEGLPGHLSAQVEVQPGEEELLAEGLLLPALELLVYLVPVVGLGLGLGQLIDLVAQVVGPLVLELGRVGESQAGVQLEVDELHQCDVEFQEGAHHPVVHVDGQVGRVLVGR